MSNAKDTYKVIEIQQAEIEEKRKHSAKFPPANTSSSSQYHQPRRRSPPPPPQPQPQLVPSFHNPGEYTLDNPMQRWKHSDFPQNQRRPQRAHPGLARGPPGRPHFSTILGPVLNPALVSNNAWGTTNVRSRTGSGSNSSQLKRDWSLTGRLLYPK